ncbi:SnoaL-like polyketide cyclase [compost metagenome]
MTSRTPAENKAIVLEGFATLFNRKDLAAAERFWSPSYIQHSAHVPPGREGLFELVAAGAPDLRYECQLAVAEDDFVMFVIQDEATREGSAGGYPMFGDQFPG